MLPACRPESIWVVKRLKFTFKRLKFTLQGALHKISALHPYDDTWVIKACVSRKYPPRTISKPGSDIKLLKLELCDDQVCSAASAASQG